LSRTFKAASSTCLKNPSQGTLYQISLFYSAAIKLPRRKLTRNQVPFAGAAFGHHPGNVDRSAKTQEIRSWAK
jgi:hypothetical protein